MIGEKDCFFCLCESNFLRLRYVKNTLLCMKLDKYNVAQSSQSIEELTKGFFRYKENYKDEAGPIYWKESGSAVSSKMSLRDRTNSRIVSFVSNDYLGFSQHPLVQTDGIRAINQFGIGFCAAPSIGGYSSFQKRLEDGLSALLKTEGTLIFNSGFSTNIGVLSALVKNEDIILLDKGGHRSVFEGVKHCVCNNKLYISNYRDTDTRLRYYYPMGGTPTEAQLYIVPIGYPAVSKRYPRLRLALSNLHSYRDIDFLISKLLTVTKKDYKYMPRKRRSSAEIAQLIDKATEDIVREKGFGGLSIQEVCDRAEIEPALFYRRYPEGFAFYVEKFIRNHDFWLSHYEDFDLEKMEGTPKELSQVLMSVWERISTDKLFESLLRLELQDSPLEASVEIAQKREVKTQGLVDIFVKNTDSPERRKIQLAIISAGLQYFALHKDVSTFCGINFADISDQNLRQSSCKSLDIL